MQRRLLRVVLLLLFPSGAMANDPCRCGAADYRDFRDLIHKVAIFDEDDRRSDEQYATENNTPLEVVKRRFAATGKINCRNGTQIGTAQLTIKHNLITTAAHLLQDSKTCKVWAEAKDCVFTVFSKGRLREIKVEKQVKSGTEGTPCPKLLADDWLILKLAEPVDDIEPYHIDSRAVADVRPDTNVVAVGHSYDYKTISVVNGKKVYQFPRHIGNCKIKRPVGNPPYKFKTNCDGSWFSSGGSLLNGNVDNPILLGICNSSPVDDKVSQAEFESGKSASGKYDENSWDMQYVAVSGDFYRAIVTAAEER